MDVNVNEKKSNKKIIIISLVILAVLIAAFSAAYIYFRPQTAEGSKTISVSIVYNEDEKSDIEIKTDAEYLREALEGKVELGGTESEFGLYIQSVNGVKADESIQQWWKLTKSGEMTDTGVDSTPIADGDSFELTLVTGW